MLLKNVFALLVVASLVLHIPIYEYRVDITIGHYSLICDVIVTKGGGVAEAACYVPQAIGATYVDPKTLVIPGTGATLAEVIQAALRPGRELGSVSVRVGYYIFNVRYRLVGESYISILSRAAISILIAICAAVVAGAVYTILRRRHYSVW